jgi:pyridoxal phosphate enzyme (YggS family)
MAEDICLNLSKIEAEINETAYNCGRKSSNVKLIAVSKKFSTGKILEAIECGQQAFGESRGQELRDKVKELNPYHNLEWHFMGRLQKNKIKYVAPSAALIHSVDSYDLAKSLAEYGEDKKLVVPVLIQINSSGEFSKTGFTPKEALENIKKLYETYPRLKMMGLMTMAPFTDDEDMIRTSFKKVSDLKNNINAKINGVQLSELSMGMSHDFKIAIEEGSTLVRIGSAIFGERKID